MRFVCLTIAFLTINYSIQAQWSFNSPPTIDDIDDYGPVLENSNQHTITLTGISDGDKNIDQFVTIIAESDNKDLLKDISVEYDQGSTALLHFGLIANSNGNAEIQVTLNDGHWFNGITTESFKLSVEDVNGKPSFQLSKNIIELDENAGKVNVRKFAYDMDDGDPDEDQGLVFMTSIINIDESLSFKSKPTINDKGDLKFEIRKNKFGEALMSLYLKDDGGTENGGIDISDEQTFIITVKHNNEPPTLDDISSPMIIFEDGGELTVNLTGISSGKNEDQLLTLSASSDSEVLVSNIVVNYQQGSPTGSLTLSTNPNKFGSAVITVTVDDGQPENNQISKQFTLEVVPVADTPTVTDAIYEGGPYTLTGLEISRNPVDGDEVTHYKITEISQGDLYYNNGIDQILNNDFISYTEGAMGLKFSPEDGISSYGSFKIQAATGVENAKLGGDVIVAQIVIENDPPIILTEPDTVVEITERYTYNVIASDPNELDQLTFKIELPEVIKTWMNIEYDGDDKATLTGTPPSGAAGVYPIIIRVEDQFGEFYEQRYDLYVKELNKLPTLSPLSRNIQEDDTIFFSKNEFSTNFSDEDGDSIQFFKLASFPQYGAVFANGIELLLEDEIPAALLNDLVYVPDKDYFGLDIFDWSASDGKDYALVPQRLSVFIASVNDPPEILFFEDNPFTFEYAEEDIALTVSGEVVDVDGDKLERAVITISDNYLINEDTIYYEIFDELTYEWQDTSGVLTIHGIATTKVYQEAIRSLRYVNLNNLSPNDRKRRIEIVLHDVDTSSMAYVREIQFKNTFVELDIPNGFTPNQDGINDTWNIENLNRYEDHRVTVFSRSGQMVFESSNFLSEWDGSFEGNIVPVGAYYYVISINKFQKVFRGQVSVLR